MTDVKERGGFFGPHIREQTRKGPGLSLPVLFGVCLHLTEMKSPPGMKKILFTREFHPEMKRVELNPRMKFSSKENL